MDTPAMRRITFLAAICATAAASFAGLTILERDRRLTKQDKKALEKVSKRTRKHRSAARLLHPLGKWWMYAPAAAATAAGVYSNGGTPERQRAAAAAALLTSAAVSALVNPLFDKLLPQPPLPPSRRKDRKPSFPSGHTFGLGAVAMTAAYVLEREEIVGRAAALPVALVPPLVGGTAKLIEGKHWPSEVAGGLLVAVAIASASVLLYEAERARGEGADRADHASVDAV